MEPLPLFELAGEPLFPDQHDRGLGRFVDVADDLDLVVLDEEVGLVDDQRLTGQCKFLGDLIEHFGDGLAGLQPESLADRLVRSLARPRAAGLHITGAALDDRTGGGRAFAEPRRAVEDRDPGQVPGAVDRPLERAEAQGDVGERGDARIDVRCCLLHNYFPSYMEMCLSIFGPFLLNGPFYWLTA